MKPTSYEMMVYETYLRLRRKYLPPEEEYEEGDDEKAEEHAIYEIASKEETDEEDVKRMIDDVRKWNASLPASERKIKWRKW